MGSGTSYNQKMVSRGETNIREIFETNYSFHVNSALRKKFNFYFSRFFASIKKAIIFAGRLGTRLSFCEV